MVRARQVNDNKRCEECTKKRIKCLHSKAALKRSCEEILISKNDESDIAIKKRTRLLSAAPAHPSTRTRSSGGFSNNFLGKNQYSSSLKKVNDADCVAKE